MFLINLCVKSHLLSRRNVYYYNFAWKDYGDATLAGLLNMVKVLAFAVSEGRVAVHCHAGLGRTGVLISCYLVYSLRVTPNDAIRYVRLKRPGSVQTRGQILCVRHFAQFILPQTITFYIKDNAVKNKYMTEFTLQRFLRRQKIVLHGYDQRNFKFLPKIIHVICERLLQICDCHTEEFVSSSIPITTDFLCSKLNENIQRQESLYSISSSLSDSTLLSSSDIPKLPLSDSYGMLNITSAPVSPNPSEMGDSSDDSYDSYLDLTTLGAEDTSEESLDENKCFQELETQKRLNTAISLDPTEIRNVAEIVDALLTDYTNLNIETKKYIKALENDINKSQCGWTRLGLETNPIVLAQLLFDWLECIKTPLLDRENLEAVVIYYTQPERCLKKIKLDDSYVIEYLLKFLAKLQPISEEEIDAILKRFIASLAQQTVIINEVAFPRASKSFNKFRDGTLSCTVQFFQSLFPLVSLHSRQTSAKSDLNLTSCDKSTRANSFEDAEVDGAFH